MTKRKGYYVSSKQYILWFFVYVGMFLLIMALSALLGAMRGSIKMSLAIGGVIGCISFLGVAVYYLFCGIYYSKKAKTKEHRSGIISNWELGFFRHSASVCLKDDSGEYSTSAYFTHDTAKQLVGQKVHYCIIDDMLYIYDIISE